MNQRFINVSIALLFVPLVIAFRLWNIQIQQGDKFRDQAKHIAVNSRAGIRGTLLDDNGVIMAVDRGVRDLYVIFREFDKDQESLGRRRYRGRQ